MRRRARRERERRFRKGRERGRPSRAAMRRFLGEFVDADQEKRRGQGRAFIPAPNAPLQGLYRVNWGVAAFTQSRKRQARLTADSDAVRLDTYKEGALFS